MPAPFGFGVGDFIAVIELITKVGKALRDSGGAASEYQDVVQELESLRGILTRLGQVRITGSTRVKPADSLKKLALNCQRPLEAFLARITAFKASLDAKTDRKFFQSAPRKIQWGVFIGSEIPKLRAVVAAKVLQLQLLLQIYATESLVNAESTGVSTQTLLLSGTAETHAQLDRVEKSTNSIQQIINKCAETQEASNAAIEVKLEHVTEKMSSQLNILERCQDYYFPTLISFAKSMNNIAKRNVNRLQEIRHCQSRYFSQLAHAHQVTHLKIEDLRILGGQLLTASRTWPEEIRGLLRMLCDTNGRIYDLLMRMQRQRGLSGSPLLSMDDCIDFEDALGRHRPLPFEYFRQWELFEAMLQVDFKDRPGYENVRQGKFHIIKDTGQQRIIRKRDWEQMIFPGEICPRPGCYTIGRRMSENSSFFTCPKCNLAYSTREDRLDRRHTGSVTEEDDIATLRNPQGPSTSESPRFSEPPTTVPEENRGNEPKDFKTHSRQDRTTGFEKMRRRDSMRAKEIRDLECFKRVHLVKSSEPQQLEVEHWIVEVFRQSRPATPCRRSNQVSRCLFRNELSSVVGNLEEFDRKLELQSWDQRLIASFHVRQLDQRALLVCESTRLVLEQRRDWLPLTCLLLARTGDSILQVHGPSSMEVWAVIEFPNYETLVLFFCSFQALKAQDCGEPVSMIGKCSIEGDEEIFSSKIDDSGYQHVLKIYRDRETRAIRLQASESSGELQNAPVWISFLTYKIFSQGLMSRVAPNIVHFNDPQPYIFTESYRIPRGPIDQQELRFPTAADADSFMSSIVRLQSDTMADAESFGSSADRRESEQSTSQEL